MENLSFLLPVSGLLSGCLLGYVARRNFFCTLSSLEQYWYGNNSAGVRTWVFAAAVAILLTQAFIYFNLFDPSKSFYLTATFNWGAAIIGGLMFGFGMALVGTCGFGALVRLGGGSLKSLMAVLILAVVALSAQRGILAFPRQGLEALFAIEFTIAGSQAIPDIVSSYIGIDIRNFLILAILAALLLWVLKDKGFRKNHAGILAGGVVGSVVATGWLITDWFSRTTFQPVQVESASFVAPVSDALLQIGLFTGIGPDYGVGIVFGVVLGSAIAAKSANDVRWEACDDARELSRHIVGAAMMGLGGVLALGCTVGQGISAASLLAISVPITMVSIVVGAKMGLSYLLEGSALSGILPTNYNG